MIFAVHTLFLACAGYNEEKVEITIEENQSNIETDISAKSVASDENPVDEDDKSQNNQADSVVDDNSLNNSIEQMIEEQLMAEDDQRINTEPGQVNKFLPEHGTMMPYVVGLFESVKSIRKKVYGSVNQNELIFGANGKPIRNCRVGDVVYYKLTPINEDFTSQYVSKTPSYYKVVRGDTLSGIAHKVYGDARSWPILWRHSRIVNPHVIYAGQRVTYFTQKIAGVDDLKSRPSHTTKIDIKVKSKPIKIAAYKPSSADILEEVLLESLNQQNEINENPSGKVLTLNMDKNDQDSVLKDNLSGRPETLSDKEFYNMILSSWKEVEKLYQQKIPDMLDNEDPTNKDIALLP